MLEKDPVDVAFALALLQQEGVGRVTAHKLLERFPTYDSLLATPREQVLLRLKGAPNAERTVKSLFDQDVFQDEIRQSSTEIRTLVGKHIQVIAEGHPHWPRGVHDLDRPNRPVVLYSFGSTDVLADTAVALHARAAVPESAFESAQLLARKLIAEGIPIACGAQTGFDVVLHKLSRSANARCVMVARCGLARVDNQARPSAAAAVKAGGVLISPFPPTHGPFDHDDAERVQLQTAIAGPSVFCDPREHTPEVHAIEWAIAAKRPVFGIVDESVDEVGPLPEHVHALARPVDYEWVIAAARVSDRT